VGEGIQQVTYGLDTSVVMRLLTGDPPDQAEVAATFLVESKAAGDRLLVTDIVIAEVYFALYSKYKVPKAEALQRLREFVEGGEVEADAASQVLRTPNLASAKPGFVDRLIHATYSNDQVHLVSFEKSLNKLAGTKVLS
jgi:predicted nucleic acid-binding protein